jgi:hypothetical protein
LFQRSTYLCPSAPLSQLFILCVLIEASWCKRLLLLFAHPLFLFGLGSHRRMGLAWPCQAWPGQARPGEPWKPMARPGQAWHGQVRLGQVSPGQAWPGHACWARPGKASHVARGQTWSGPAALCLTMRGLLGGQSWNLPSLQRAARRFAPAMSLITQSLSL